MYSSIANCQQISLFSAVHSMFADIKNVSQGPFILQTNIFWSFPEWRNLLSIVHVKGYSHHAKIEKIIFGRFCCVSDALEPSEFAVVAKFLHAHQCEWILNRNLPRKYITLTFQAAMQRSCMWTKTPKYACFRFSITPVSHTSIEKSKKQWHSGHKIKSFLEGASDLEVSLKVNNFSRRTLMNATE